GRLLSISQVASCSASNNGRCIFIRDVEFGRIDEVVFPYLAAGESATATLELRLIDCKPVSSLDGNVTAYVSVSTVTDRDTTNNTDQKTINVSPPARIIVGGGAADIRLGPVTPGVHAPTNPPSVTFSLENIGCIPLQ